MESQKLAYSDPSFEVQEFSMVNTLGTSTGTGGEWNLPEF